ncbi:MAG: L,D-transpeptidase [Enterocloster clostridioformis]
MSPEEGSAIFLHRFTASRDNGSAGCIRPPQEVAKELVQSATERTKIVIAPDLERLK